ncbi:MAG: hypothetical protein M0T83_08815 [Nitrospiraceae bacterium]|jgi:hypothetical protein|nr:hypothetical protein [Nitrospiraceae bacterium]
MSTTKDRILEKLSGKPPEPISDSHENRGEAEPSPPRQIIERLLSCGPKPYLEILAAVGGDEDALRDAIRDMTELIAFDDKGVWTWELRPPGIDPETLAERVGIRFDGPPALGKAVLTHPRDGSALAFEGDPPHVRLFAWSLLNVPPGGAVQIDPAKAAKECQLRPVEVKDALRKLVADGDLVRSMERGRELYRLVITYK